MTDLMKVEVQNPDLIAKYDHDKIHDPYKDWYTQVIHF
ncbi:MAG: hypothetical protein ACI9Y7_002310 [Dokdonia sp.]|jgi:hypothetical protein